MKRFFPVLLFFYAFLFGHSQGVMKSALFLGNSYTYANNLPLLVAALAHYNGDSLYYNSNTPGGYTLGWQPIAHCYDTASLNKIKQRDWDFVVLQEQSQTPAIPALRDSCMLPGSIILLDSIKSNHYCSQLLFYLTWGRRFGGIQCFDYNYCSTNFSGFDQMQDSVTRAYKIIADSIGGWIAPAGEAWRLVLHNSSMVLHDLDNSHPNLKGSYLTACVFYSSIFRKKSTGISFTAGLPSDTALFLQQAADSVVFGYFNYWNLWKGEPEAAFQPTLHHDTLITTNFSVNANRWFWDFGDGATSTLFEPIHIYANTGNFLVKLVACDTCRCDTTQQSISVVINGLNQIPLDHGMILYNTPHSNLIKCLNCKDDGEIFIYDLMGRLIQKSTLSNGETQIYPVEKGIYLFVFKKPSGNMYTGKLIVRE